MSDPAITVLTVTRGRPQKLEHAMASVQNQDCEHSWRHLILIDDCRETADKLSGWRDLPTSVEWQYMPREAGEGSGPGRLAKLRNLGAQHAESRWIAFLDDDNEWKPDHLRSLTECALATGARAVHSYVQAFHPDGSPYLDPVFPWARTLEEGLELHAKMVAAGVYAPGSNIFRDRVDPPGTPDPVRSVDAGAWLLERALLLQVPLRLDYDEEDAANRTTDDDKLIDDLIALAEPIACTHKASLIYYLGGFSNNESQELEASFSWVGSTAGD